MSPLTFAILLLVLYVLLKVFKFKRMKALMPPGPPGIFILGNALQLPKEQAFRQLKKWGDTYGPIISLDMAGQPVVIINSLKVANDLFGGLHHTILHL
ncbi:hypothetical protein EIP86_002642 [Pleurotus ostreatoroseus]|nr:hypothetical protein EIP86_002642 [Pleurotus ostreatoroseus]